MKTSSTDDMLNLSIILYRVPYVNNDDHTFKLILSIGFTTSEANNELLTLRYKGPYFEDSLRADAQTSLQDSPFQFHRFSSISSTWNVAE